MSNLKIHFSKASFALIGVSLLIAASFMVLISEDAVAETKPGGTLKNDRSARIYTTGWWWTSIPDELEFKVPTKTNEYTAVAIMNREPGEDFDLFAYDDYEMDDSISSSTKGSDEIDFVVIDGHTYTGNYKYAKVVKFTGQDWTDGVRIESDYHTVASDLYGSDPDANGDLVIGERRYSLFEDHGTGTYDGTLRGDLPIVNMYDVYLDAGGSYDFDIYSVPPTEKLSMYLFRGSGNSDNALISDHASSSGEDLSFSYDPEISGNYGLCVIDENFEDSSTNNYTILITSDFEMGAQPTSHLIAPGMNASYQIDVSSFGITKDIDLHYRWQTAGSVNTSTPSGASATLSRYSVNTDGASTESVYLNITTTSSLTAGNYYLMVYGNDTGYAGETKGVKVMLRVSTNPDYFISADPEYKVTSPGSNAVYSLTMDTINSYTNSVTMTATPDTGSQYFNVTFSSNPISSSNDFTNMMIEAASNTPVGTYNFSVQGSDGTLVRYANITLRVKEPINVDIIAPTANELIGGAYTFKVKADTPEVIKSVKITFGGKMQTAGTLNLYYNAASLNWERTVSTYSFPDGSCWFNVTVEDFADGITNYGPNNFTLSNSPPNPIINKPLDRSYVTSVMPISVNTTSYVISARFKVDQNAWIPLTRDGNVWNGSYDTSQITDGTHTLTIEAKDSAGLTGESTLTIFVDNTNPTAYINSPIDGNYLEGSYTFRVVATDAVGVSHVDINIFGNTITLPYNPITSSYEYTVSTQTRPDGTYTVYATAYDFVNQLTDTDTITFYIDNNDPSLSINSPESGEIIGGIYNLSIASSDLFLQKVEYRIDSGGWQNLSGSDPDWWVHLNTTDLQDGSHTLFVRSQDMASHLTEQSIPFTVDNNQPTCNMVSPFNGRFIERVFSFQVSATDTVGIDRVVLEMFSDSVQTTLNKQTGYYEYQFNTLTVTDGIYNVTAVAYDLSGKNTNSTEVTFRVDNFAPELAVVGLQTGDYISGTLGFTVNVSDAFLKDVMYSIDGGGWVNSTQTWDTTTILDGSHIITIRARDQAGHTTTQTLTLIVDNNVPVCSINSPVADEFVEGTYTFRLSASDSVGIDRVYLNVFNVNFTATFSGSSGYYECTTDTSIRTDGNYSCRAISYDLSGKVAQSSWVSFKIDNSAPQMTVNGLQTGDYVSGNVTFNVTATDRFLLDVGYSVDGGTWNPITELWLTNNLLDGSHSVIFRARDSSGHDIKQTMTLIVDNTYPVITINSPSPDEFLDQAYTFRISAIDSVGIDRVYLSVFGTDFLATFSSSSGYFEFTTDTTLKTDGIYQCTASGHDLSGKISISSPVTFRIDNNAPVLRVVDPLPGAFLEGYILISVNTTDVFLNRTEYSVDGTGWVDETVPLNTSTFGDGNHLITIRSLDDAGHTTTTAVNVIIDNYLPVGTISYPGANAFVTELTPVFRVVASDIVGIDHVMIGLDFPGITGDLSMSYNSATGYYEFRTDVTLIPDGDYNITVTIQDLSGKVLRIGPVMFNVDTHSPEIVLNDMGNGYILSGKTSINILGRDVHLNRITYRIDENEPVTLSYDMIGEWANASFLLDTSIFNDGTHTITFNAYDSAGWSSSVSFSIFMDNIAPTCTITSPVSSEFVEGVITIRVTAFDIVGIDYVTIHVYDLDAKVPFNAQTGYYEYSSNTITWGAGEDGVRNVTAIAFDLTGKSYTFGPIFFNVDNRAPTININSPNEGEIVSGLFFFDVVNSDVFKKGTDYNIDGASWQPVSIGWNTAMVPDGHHEVTIRATDLAGHVTTEFIIVIVDNNYPEIGITGPNNGEFIEGTYTFRISATDEVGIKHVILKLAGMEKRMSLNTLSGYYEYTMDTRTLTDGTYKMNATVLDLSGKTLDTSLVEFNVDNNNPELTVEAPVKDQLISGIFVVRAYSDDEFPGVVKYAIDGTTWFDVTKTWNTTKVIDGRHTVTIRTVDMAGHMTDFDVEVVVDNTAPIISQATIIPGQSFAGVQTLRFYAYDSIGIRQVQLSIDDRPAFEIYRGEGGLYYEYLLDTKTVSDGDHLLKVQCIDRAGNHMESSYGIKVDNTGPEITLDYYWIKGDQEIKTGEVKEGTSVVFEAIVKDPSGVENVMINIDSQGWREMTPDANSSHPNKFILFWPTSGVNGGSHIFQIRSTDSLGNERVSSGMISVKEYKEKDTFIQRFTDYLPLIWLILFIILVILIFVLFYTGVITKWAKGEGMKKENPDQPVESSKESSTPKPMNPKEKTDEPQKNEEKRKIRNPFKKKETVPEDTNWDQNGPN